MIVFALINFLKHNTGQTQQPIFHKNSGRQTALYLIARPLRRNMLSLWLDPDSAGTGPPD